jgi:hypothetical protein
MSKAKKVAYAEKQRNTAAAVHETMTSLYGTSTPAPPKKTKPRKQSRGK